MMTIEGLKDGKVLVLLVGKSHDKDNVRVLVQVVGQCGGQKRQANAWTKLLDHPDLINVRIQLK